MIVGVTSVGVMTVGVLSVGVMTVGVLSVGVMTTKGQQKYNTREAIPGEHSLLLTASYEPSTD
jgi:hypothetical protein